MIHVLKKLEKKKKEICNLCNIYSKLSFHYIDFFDSELHFSNTILIMYKLHKECIKSHYSRDCWKINTHCRDLRNVIRTLLSFCCFSGSNYKYNNNNY